MSGPPNDTRYEIKFVTPVTEAYRLDAWVAAHPLAFGVAYPPRQVNNVYFDNAELVTYDENLSGTSARTKIRFRWYGTDEQQVSGKLELKFKRNKLGWKRSFGIRDVPLAGTPWREAMRTIREQLPLEGRVWLDEHPEPVVINRYSRRYLVSADGLIRVTLDTRLQIFDQRMRGMPDFACGANLPDVLLVEVKADAVHHELLGRAVRDIPLRGARFSKYASGLANILS